MAVPIGLADTINLGLFNSIWTILICLGAYALPLIFLAFLVFTALVMCEFPSSHKGGGGRAGDSAFPPSPQELL